MNLEIKKMDPTFDDTQWRFHLLGSESVPTDDVSFNGQIQSLALGSLFVDQNELSHYPLVVLEDFSVLPLKSFMKNQCEELGSSMEILTTHMDFFVHCTSEALQGTAASMELLPALKAGLVLFLEKMELSEAGRHALNTELDSFFGSLPVAQCLGLGAHTGLELYFNAIRASKSEQTRIFVSKAMKTKQSLQNILAVQEAKESEKVKANSDQMGTVSGSMFKENTVSPRKTFGTFDLTPERKQRIESCISAIDSFIESSRSGTKIILVHADDLPVSELPDHVKSHQDNQPMAVALDVFKGQVSEMTELFRSLRTAKLEIDNAYDESYHTDILGQLNMSTFTEEEWSFFPMITVLEHANQIISRGMSEFSHILSSNLPINILVHETPWEDSADREEEIKTNHRDLGYLAIAHRDSFVLRSSMAQPMHLFDGFSQLTAQSSCGVVVISTPKPGEKKYCWDLMHAFDAGRASNLYLYNPSAGTHWADRFSVDGSIQINSSWPKVETSLDNESHELEFTYADAVSTLPEQRKQFMLLSEDQWTDCQVPLAEFLANPEKLYGKFVPFIWVQDELSTVRRAILSRELSLECLDLMGLWQTLQELAGIGNSHAILFGEKIKSETESLMHSEIEELKAKYQQEIETVRTETARDALGQLARVLVEMDPGQELNLTQSSMSVPIQAEPAIQDDTTPPPQQEPEPGVPEPIEEEEEVAEEAFVDTDLCTSCNECVDLNQLLFVYDANKQVEIGDINAGTYLQLVSAAEKCPSRCIHPGSPRPGDSTVTDELIAKAAKYN